MSQHLNDEAKYKILCNAKTIVIVGLSPNEYKPSYEVAQYLIENGYNIIPIYPRGGEILGCKVYTSLPQALQSLAHDNQKCDIINIFRKSEALPVVLDEVCALKHNNAYDTIFSSSLCVWMQLGLTSQEARQKAQECNILYEEDSCIKLEHQRLFALKQCQI